MFLLYKFGNFFKLEQNIQIVIFLRKCLSKRILLFPYLWKCKCRFSILLRWSTDHLPSSALLMPFIGIRPIHFPLSTHQDPAAWARASQWDSGLNNLSQWANWSSQPECHLESCKHEFCFHTVLVSWPKRRYQVSEIYLSCWPFENLIHVFTACEKMKKN